MRQEVYHPVDKFNYEVLTLTLMLNCNFALLVSGYKRDYCRGLWSQGKLQMENLLTTYFPK